MAKDKKPQETPEAVEAAPVEASAPKGETHRYRVTVRHSPAPLKRHECAATDEADAFRQYVAALKVKLGERHGEADVMAEQGQRTVVRV